MLVAALVIGPLPAAAQPGVHLVIQGSPASLAGPAVMRGGEVMVPAIRTFESYGASTVWQPADRTITVTTRTGRSVRMKIGAEEAIVAGQTRAMRAAPAIINGQPYVPANDVFALLGAWVRFDDAARALHIAAQITTVDVRRGDGAALVVLGANGAVRAESRVLPNPDRVVIDLHGAAFRLADQDIAVGAGGVKRLRAAQFQTKPYVTRVVLDLMQTVETRVLTVPDSYDLTIEIRTKGGVPAVQAPVPAPNPPAAAAAMAAPVAPAPVAPPAPPAPPTPPVSSPPPSGHDHDMRPAESQDHLTPPPAAPAVPNVPDDGVPRVLQVRTEQVAGRFRVVIEGTMPLDYAVRELLEPDRLVVDIAGAIFIPIKQEIPIAGAVVTEVRAAQFQASPHVTRVVVVLKRKTAYTVSPEGSPTLTIEIPETLAATGHVVAIDAGHGGIDTGAIGPTGTLEKEIVLDVSLRVREALVRSGVRVVMTRETDATVALADRPRIARQQGVTAFVSIHANASTRPAVNGSETYFLTSQSLPLAQAIQEELSRISGLIGRGTRTANFLVLRESEVPAVLVEVAYLSNVDEEVKLRQNAFRQKLADAIARGIQRYLTTAPVPSAGS
jgi:N-acetylmuramoyl-L-alanine amidase